MTYTSKNNTPPKTRDLPMPVEAKQLYDVSEQSWKVLKEGNYSPGSESKRRARG